MYVMFVAKAVLRVVSEHSRLSRFGVTTAGLPTSQCRV
jgi:hypothetical protein